MASERPKLLILTGSNTPASDLEHRLEAGYDVSVVAAGALLDALRSGGVNIIAGHPADLAGPQSGLGEAASKALLDAMGMGACLAWADGGIFWANQRFGDYEDQLRAEVSIACREAAQAAQEGRWAPAVARVVEVATAGEPVYFEVLVAPVLPPGGLPTLGQPVEALAAVVRSVTSERRYRRMIDAIDRAGSELVGLEADAVRKMNVFDRLRLLESKITARCRDLLHFDHFAIRLIDKKSGRLELVMTNGLQQEASELEIYPKFEGNGISGRVAATGVSYVCRDTEKDPLFLPGLAGARSSVTVPLKLSDRVIGTFDIESQAVSGFGDQERQYAEIFGRYIAMALHILDLLVAERSTTNESVSGRVVGEIAEPLQNILEEADWLKTLAAGDPEAATHVARILEDVAAIRRRLENVTAGPQTLLGVERAMSERKREPLLEGKHVLVADDESGMRRIIHDILQNRGCEVATFESGVGAIAALEAAAAGKRPPFDAIISDIKMPDRNGYEVFAAARKMQPGVPVILMTGYGYDPHHSSVRASEEGLQSVLFKPFPVERLLDEVRRAVTPKP